MSDDPRFAQAVELTIATYDRIAHDYDGRHEEMPPFWAERMERFLDLVREAEDAAPVAEMGLVDPDGELEEYLTLVPLLDAGCGPGRDARALAARGLPVLGVDLSHGMLDEARERTARRLPRGAIRYALMDLRRLELPDACCRAVWCSASLLHLPKQVAPRAMRELARVARRDAPLALFLKGATARPEQEIIPYPFGTEPDVPRFFAYYTPEDAQTLVRAAGFVVREVALAPDPRMEGMPPWICVLAVKG
jgi:SAM-dependent methyltransferase